MADKQSVPVAEWELEQIQPYLENLQYGTITLIVQDSRLVRIERLEKFKLND